MTYSIVGWDPEVPQWGVAVQSKFLAVGSVVSWASAGVGAIATQAWANPQYGPDGLALLREGLSAAEVVERLVAADDGRDERQLGVVDGHGGSASHTGANCHDWAGHRTGDGYAAQGNILVSRATVDALAETFEAGAGRSLARRLIDCLAAAQVAGGDKRGQQSAALIVERAGGRAESREGIDRICDLRVEDHAQPIVELRRLIGIWTDWDAQRRAHVHYERGDAGAAADLLRSAVAGKDTPMLLYNLACYEALAGRSADALAHLRRAVELDGSYRALAAEDPDFDPIRSELSEL